MSANATVTVSPNGKRSLTTFFGFFLVVLYLPTTLLMVFAFNDSTTQSWPPVGFTTHWFSDAANDFASFEEAFDLERVFEELPDGDREACRLRYLEGLEIDEIAGRLGKTRNAVDQSLHRAHKRLKELARAN